MPATVSVIVCAYNEQAYLADCLYSLKAQTLSSAGAPRRRHASTDATGEVARHVPGVKVVDEPRRGLVVARERGRRETAGELLVYLDADCRAPLLWLERVVARFARRASLAALTGPYISADQSPDAILREIRRQGAVSVACHPHHRTTRRIEISTCYLWDERKQLADLVDVWEAANRDDLFSVTSLKHYPYVASSDFHKAKHLYSWKTLLRCEKTWPSVRRALCENVDVALTCTETGAGAVGRAGRSCLRRPRHGSALRVFRRRARTPDLSAAAGRWAGSSASGCLARRTRDGPPSTGRRHCRSRALPHARRPAGAARDLSRGI